MASQYHTTKDGKKAKKGLYYYINRKKKAGKSNPKSKSTHGRTPNRNLTSSSPQSPLDRSIDRIASSPVPRRVLKRKGLLRV